MAITEKSEEGGEERSRSASREREERPDHDRRTKVEERKGNSLPEIDPVSNPNTFRPKGSEKQKDGQKEAKEEEGRERREGELDSHGFLRKQRKLR